MRKEKLSQEGKAAELKKYRDLVLSTIDYHLDNNLIKLKTSEFDSDEHYKLLKAQTEEHFQKGRLTKLRRWFRDLTEMQVETNDIKFNKYLQDKTHYNIDIFKSYFQRVDKIIEKGKITNENQFYDITIMIDQISQTVPVDNKKMEVLNNLLSDYERRKKQKT